MTKRILLLVIATAALGGGFLALRGKRSRTESSQEQPAGPLLLPAPPRLLLLPAPSLKPLLHPHFPHPFHLTPRVAGLLVAAVVLTIAASIGMGEGSEVATAATAAPRAAAAALGATPAPGETAPDDAIGFSNRPERLAAAAAAPALTAAAAPTPAVAAEIAVPTPEPVPEPAAAPPAPTAPPVVIPADGIEAIICALPWPCAEAVAVAACESGRNMQGRLDGNWATNGANFGLFQINAVHAGRWPDFYQDWMDPAKNAEWAYEIWQDSGWYPWDCRWAAYS